MQSNKLDKRSIRTRAAIENSLLRMLSNTLIDDISIKKLCEEANVNRTTFYLHYSGINNVLDEIREDFIQRVLKNYPTPKISNDNKPYFNFLKAINNEIANPPLFENFLITSNEAGSFIQHLKESFYQKIYNILESATKADKKNDCELITMFLCSGIIDSYFLWLKKGKKTSLDSFVCRYRNL